MIIDDYDDDVDVDEELLSGISGYEIAYSNPQKTKLRKTAKQKYRIKQKIESLYERRRFDKETNTLSDYWEM